MATQLLLKKLGTTPFEENSLELGINTFKRIDITLDEPERLSRSGILLIREVGSLLTYVIVSNNLHLRLHRLNTDGRYFKYNLSLLMSYKEKNPDSKFEYYAVTHKESALGFKSEYTIITGLLRDQGLLLTSDDTFDESKVGYFGYGVLFKDRNLVYMGITETSVLAWEENAEQMRVAQFDYFTMYYKENEDGEVVCCNSNPIPKVRQHLDALLFEEGMFTLDNIEIIAVGMPGRFLGEAGKNIYDWCNDNPEYTILPSFIFNEKHQFYVGPNPSGL
jgi:hypothetical protein